jgi:hypothetical protein
VNPDVAGAVTGSELLAVVRYPDAADAVSLRGRFDESVSDVTYGHKFKWSNVSA